MKKSVYLFYFGCLCQQESFSAAFNGPLNALEKVG